jgi:hypothetical protein
MGCRVAHRERRGDELTCGSFGSGVSKLRYSRKEPRHLLRVLRDHVTGDLAVGGGWYDVL